MPSERTKMMEKLRAAGFTESDLSLLANMKRGDEANKKGSMYEAFFGAYLMLSQYGRVCSLSNSATAYVDDWQITEGKTRRNYQLKNSDGTAGRWSDKLAKAFTLQEKADKIHGFQPTNYLVCSSQTNHRYNLQHIGSSAVYFPYHKSRFAMLRDTGTHLAELLQQVCPDHTQHDTALLYLTAVLQGNVNKNLADLWEEVLHSAKPNVFTVAKPLPKAFADKCKALDITLHGCYLQWHGFFIMTDDRFNARVQDLPETAFKDMDNRQFIRLLQTLAAQRADT